MRTGGRRRRRGRHHHRGRRPAGHDGGRVAGTGPTDCRTSWSAAARSTRCGGPRPSSTRPDPSRPVLAVTLAGPGCPAARCGRAWICSKRTPPHSCCCRTSGGGARSRTRWPRRRDCWWNRPSSCPGRCAPTPRRCASWSTRWRPRAASLAIRSGTRTPVSDDRHARRTGSDERPARRDAAGRRWSARSVPLETRRGQGAGPARPARYQRPGTGAGSQHRAPVVAAPTTSRPPTLGTPPPAPVLRSADEASGSSRPTRCGPPARTGRVKIGRAPRPSGSSRSGEACVCRRPCAARSSRCSGWRSGRCPAATSPRRRRGWTPPASPPPRASTCRSSPTSPRSSARSSRRCGWSPRSRPSPAGIRPSPDDGVAGLLQFDRFTWMAAGGAPWSGRTPRRGDAVLDPEPTCGSPCPGCAAPCAPSRATSPTPGKPADGARRDARLPRRGLQPGHGQRLRRAAGRRGRMRRALRRAGPPLPGRRAGLRPAVRGHSARRHRRRPRTPAAVHRRRRPTTPAPDRPGATTPDPRTTTPCRSARPPRLDRWRDGLHPARSDRGPLRHRRDPARARRRCPRPSTAGRAAR